MSLSPLRLSLLFAAGAALGLAALAPVPAARAAAGSRRGLAFEANRGQHGPGTRYLARGERYGISLTDRGAVLTLAGAAGRRAALTVEARGGKGRLRAADRLPGHVSYFRGRDPRRWQAGIPTFGRVLREGVYPGVDMVYYGREGLLEYDFVVAPGADPSPIRVGVEGASSLALDAAGDLRLRTAAGEVVQRAPVAYQESGGTRRTVPARYVLSADRREVRFALGPYDRARPLVIDPVLDYSTLVGGSRADGLNAVAVDSDGSAFAVGFTASPDYPTTSGAYDRTRNDSNVDYFDACVTRLAEDGESVLWSTYLGGSERDSAVDVALGEDGTVYVTGTTRSTDFPTTAGAYDRTNATTAGKAFAARLSPQGSALEYSTYLGALVTAGGDVAGGIAVDRDGNAYLTGTAVVTTGGAQDAYLRKLSPDGSDLEYAVTIGGDAADFGNRVAVTSNGEAYVVGTTRSDDFPATDGAFRETFGGGTSDAFVVRMNRAGTAFIFATYLGGAASDAGNAIALDSSGRAYVAGATGSGDFPTTIGALDRTLSGGEAFVVQLTASGAALVYGTYLGGADEDGATGIALDGLGNAAVAGFTRSRDFPVTSDAFQRLRTDTAGQADAFVAVLTPGGASLRLASYLGGDGDDVAYGLAREANSGALFLAGATAASRFPTTPGAFQVAGTPGGNGFVARVSEGVPPATPAAPSNLTAEAVGTDRIRLQWRDNSNNETGFEVVRFTGVTWSLRATLGAGSTTFQDTGLTANQAYTYIVRAVRESTASPWSNEASARTASGPPDAPTDLQVLAVSDRAVRLGWRDRSDSEEGFMVQRRRPGGEFGSLALLPADTTVYDDRTVLPRTAYEYRVIATSEAGDSDPSNVVEVTTGNPPPPAPPTNLEVTAAAPTRVDLSWEDNSTNETGFEVERATGSGAFQRIATVSASTALYSDRTVTAGTTYRYRVRAVGSGGNSLYSNTVEVRAPGQSAPPSGLRVTTVSNTSLRLEWRDNSSDETAFRIERSRDGQTFARVGAVNADVTTFTDTGLAPDTAYFYRVQAVTPAGSTGFSNTAQGQTLSGRLEAPEAVAAVATGPRRVEVSWRDTSEIETGFRIERKVPGGAFALVGSAAANATLFVDRTARPSTTYVYRVAAGAAGAVSPYSSEVTVTTPVELDGFRIQPGKVSGGESARGSVALSGPAPRGGVTVRLSANRSWVRFPDRVQIPEGRTLATFQIRTPRVRRKTRVTFTARAGGQALSARLVVRR